VGVSGLRAVPGFAFTTARLFGLQSAWSYERMLGIGFAHAMEPLLRPLRAADGGTRYHDALARGAQFFNAHPYVTSLAIGATARAEVDGVPPEKIERLRQALCGPLGALGDRLVWAGWLPVCSALGLILVGFGAAGWGVAAFLILYNAVHVALRVWGLRAGWREGMRVATALANPVLHRGLEVVGPLAALAVGVALPVVLVWAVRGAGLHLPWWLTWRHLVAAGAGAGAFALLAGRLGTRITGLRLATLVLAVAAVGGVLWR
jgi:PTS system mannose-specific IID component